MRDERGRYISTKVITANGPAWARGCGNCNCGIVSAPDLTGACEFYLERMVQAIETKGAIFCTCRAGQAYRANLLNRRQERIEEARKDPRMQEQARRQTHPEIEIAMVKVATLRAEIAPVPTIRWTGEEPLAPPADEVEEDAVGA